MSKHLFLFGGSPPFTENMAKKFADLAIIYRKPVSILFVEREGWESYMPKYTQPLEELGLHDFYFLPLPSSPISEVALSLHNSAVL